MRALLALGDRGAELSMVSRRLSPEDPAGVRRESGPPRLRRPRDRIFESVSDSRSRVMQSIRGRDTGPELRVRSYLHREGIQFRLRSPGLPCRPDLVLPALRIALFVHGCFWHQHPGCPHATVPKVRARYWRPKLIRNRSRDRDCSRALSDLGWKVLVAWECELDESRLKKLAERIKRERGRRRREREARP